MQYSKPNQKTNIYNSFFPASSSTVKQLRQQRREYGLIVIAWLDALYEHARGVVYWMFDVEKVEICDLNWFYLATCSSFLLEKFRLVLSFEGRLLVFLKALADAERRLSRPTVVPSLLRRKDLQYVSMSICVVLGQWRNWSEWRACVKRSTTRFGHPSDKFRPSVRLAANQWCRKCVLQCHKADQGLILATQKVL